MDYDWKRAVRNADRHGSASSGSLGRCRSIKFWTQGNEVIYRDCRNNTKIIRDLREIGPRSILFFGHQDGAIFTLPNTEETAIVMALTTAIIAGRVKIDGEFDCVNSLYTGSNTNAASFTAESPVPICTSEDMILTGKVGRVRVTRGAASWYIWKAHFGHPHDTDELEPDRIHMCGGLGEKHIRLQESARRHFTKQVFDAYSGRSRLLVGDVVRRTALIATNELGEQRIRVVQDEGVIQDQVVEDIWFKRAPGHEYDATQYYQMEVHGLSAREEPGYLFSFRKGEKTYKIYDRHKSFASTNLEVTEVEVVPTGRVAHDDVVKALFEVPKAMGTLRIRNLRGLAQAFCTTEQGILAHFSRAPQQFYQLNKVSYIDIEVPGETQVTLRPESFDKLRGVTLLQVGHTLWSAGTGRPVSRLLKNDVVRVEYGNRAAQVAIEGDELIG